MTRKTRMPIGMLNIAALIVVLAAPAGAARDGAERVASTGAKRTKAALKDGQPAAQPDKPSVPSVPPVTPISPAP